MKSVVFCLALLAAGNVSAEIYTWIDAQGVRHYSDNAGSAAAKPADLPGIQSQDANKDALAELRASAAAMNARNAAGAPSRIPQLDQPQSQATFRDAQGIVPISLTIGGASSLEADEQVTYYLDGSPIPQSPTNQTQLQLGNVPRGTHTISAALLYQGREIRRTEPVTFFMHPPTAISPLNANQGGETSSDVVPGATVAPPAGNAAGATAAPRINSGSSSGGLAPG